MWKCKYCKSDEGTWFSRTEPMGNFCRDCGKCADDGCDAAGEPIENVPKTIHATNKSKFIYKYSLGEALDHSRHYRKLYHCKQCKNFGQIYVLIRTPSVGEIIECENCKCETELT